MMEVGGVHKCLKTLDPIKFPNEEPKLEILIVTLTNSPGTLGNLYT